MKREKDIIGFLKSIGVIKRKLTRAEAREITDVVVNSSIKNPDSRFRLACVLAFQKIV